MAGSSLQQKLEQLLASTVDDEREAATLLREALKKSARARLPDAAPELLAFVRGHLMEPLAKRVGQQLAATFIAELQRESDRLWRRALRGRPSTDEFQAPTIPKARDTMTPAPSPARIVTGRMRALARSTSGSGARVVLAGFDAVMRGVLERGLAAAGCEVLVLDKTDDAWLVTWLVGVRAYTLVIDMSHPACEQILTRLQRDDPPKLVLAKMDSKGAPESTQALLRRLGVRSHRLLDPGVTASGICFALQNEAGK